MKINDPSQDGLAVGYYVLNPSNNSTTLSGQSKDFVSEKQMAGRLSVNDSGKQIITWKRYVPIYLAAGLTKLQFDADPDNFTAPVTGDPGSLVQFEYAAVDPFGS